MQLAHELERDGDAALHVARAETVHGAVLDPSGQVALRRNRVHVPREHDERSVRTALGRPQACAVDLGLELERGRHEVPDVLRDRRFPSALGRNVDKLESSRSEPGREVGHGD